MKICMLVTAILLCCTPAFGQSGDKKLPLQQRISAEKVILAEKYQSDLQKCRERTRKRAKESCIERKKNEIIRVFADLEQDPKAYFAAQERNSLNEKALPEKNDRLPRQLPQK